MTASSYWANIFNRKVEQGWYSQEHVKCFCGADNYVQITNTDRYGIKYQLCLCIECGILYANPRMTQKSYERFYREDYRNIYSDFGETLVAGGHDISRNMTRESIGRIMDSFELPSPRVVFDVGCGRGDLLAEFNADTIGIDYDETAIADGQSRGRNIFHGGLEILEGTGKKADLIILHHVLEHFLDLKSELARIRDLLSDEGVLYVAVPGFYVWDKGSIFQNAHTYQFNGNTLWYVMRCCGFDDLHLDENIESLWKKSDFMEMENKNPEEARLIHNFLFDEKRLLPPVRVSCKFPLKERRENLRWILSSGIHQITDLVDAHFDREAVIICGGPSIEGYKEKIKELYRAGHIIVAIERMYQWCLDLEIIPHYIVAMDAEDDVIESFHRTHSETKHILMCQCKPEVFQLLQNQGRDVYFFLVPQKGIPLGEYCQEFGIGKIIMVNSAGSVSLGAFSIAMTLGMKKVHFFGFDLHVTQKNYADGITGVGDIKGIIEVEINGKTFSTTSAYLAFMQHFFNLYAIGKQTGVLESVRIYGDSIISVASKEDISDEDRHEKVANE